jgi:HK97 family phage major capsid protein/HK97 family phage prohead protease
MSAMPTEGMREEAQRYRDWKEEGREGGTDVAARRASQILSGDELSDETIVTMSAWFARHEVDKQAEGFSPGEEGYPSPGRVAWAAWGGDAGKTWSDRLVEAMDRSIETEQRAEPDALSVGDFVSWDSSGGRARGKIERIERDGSINVPDSEFTVNGTEEDPAALIQVYREGDDGWEATETKVGHRFSTLTKIEALRAMEVDSEAPEVVAEEESKKDLTREIEGTKFQRVESTSFNMLDERSMEFPFSSEYPVARYFGNEVLSHEMESANLSRLNDGAPLLFNHDPDRMIGVVERAWIDGEKKRGYAKVRFSRNKFAQEVLEDVRDGILRGVSFGYSIDKMEERNNDFVATNWSPYEVSLAVIPADPTVGVGRSLEDTNSEPAASTASPENTVTEPVMDNTPDLEVIRSEAVEAERTRTASISKLGERHALPELARELIDGGKSVDEARAAFLEKIGTQPVEHSITANDLGLTEKETRSFSFVKALNFLSNQGDAQARRDAAFEIEVGEAAAKKYERSSNGIVIPNEVLRRDLVVGTPTAGGNLVDDVLLAGSFIDLLRNRLAITQAGITMLTGLQGNISVPRQTSSSTGYWVGEGSAPGESQQAIDQVNMTPKTVGAWVDYSRRLLLQSSIDVEGLVRDDLARVIALEIDRAAIYGTGSSNQPLGLTNVSGIGSETLTGTGTFTEFIAMETDVAAANADAGALRYIVNATTRGGLKGTKKDAGSGEFVFADGEINGYPAIVSNQLANNDALFGDFSMFVMGMWSGLDLTVDPYAGATAGTVRVIALQDVDFAVRQPSAFCFAT